MANYINGYSFPRFRILDSSDNLIQEIDLDLTNEEGLEEKYSSENIKHVLEWNKEIVKVRRSGKRRITFTLNYNQHFKKDLAFKIFSILQYEENGFKIIIIPRSDVLSRQFEVTCTDEDLITKINKGGANANSNYGLVVAWETKRLEFINPIDPDDIFVTFNNIVVI